MGSRRTLTVISSLGGLLFGYDTDIISGNVLYVRDDLGILLSRIGMQSSTGSARPPCSPALWCSSGPYRHDGGRASRRPHHLAIWCGSQVVHLTYSSK